jgi:hypothetical protein
MNSTHDEYVSKVKISKVEKTLINRISQLLKPALFDVVVSNGETQYSARSLMKLASKDHVRVENNFKQLAPNNGYYRLVPFVEVINWDEDVSDGIVKMNLDSETSDYIESIISETQLTGRHLTIDDVFTLLLADQAKAYGSIALGILISLVASICYINDTYYHVLTSYVKKVFRDKRPLVLRLHQVPLNKVYVEDPYQYSNLWCHSEETITITFDYRGITSSGFSVPCLEKSTDYQKDDCR